MCDFSILCECLDWLCRVIVVLDPSCIQILGTPKINCNAEDIELEFESLRQFTGKVYVKGNYNKPECRVDYSKRTKDGRPTGGIRLNHGACNMDRQRLITPDGMMFSTVLVISFHPVQPIMFSPTEPLHMDMPMPTCTYTIRKDTLDGPILKYARVGDQVVHRWECDSVATWKMDKAKNNKLLMRMVVILIEFYSGIRAYVEALNMAYRESFAPNSRTEWPCDFNKMTTFQPPICFDMQHRHVSEFVPELQNNTITRKRRKAGAVVKDADLISQTVYVFEADDNNNVDENGDLISASPLSGDRDGVCIGIGLFTVLAISLTIMLLLLTSMVVYMFVMKMWRTQEKQLFAS
ncbi:unnamed protein product, partial [Mesorhabditis spiculigera]